MNCESHENHAHQHGEQCGHTAIQHGDHTDYLHNGHLHSAHTGHYDEHALSVTASNPDDCVPVSCGCGHQDCDHEPVPHGDHKDFVFDGLLHHPHGNHCDNHGALQV